MAKELNAGAPLPSHILLFPYRKDDLTRTWKTEHEDALSDKCIDEWVESRPCLSLDPKLLLEMTIPSSPVHAKFRFKSEWRKCTTVDQFAALTGLDPAGTEVLHLVTAPHLVRNQRNLSTAIVEATRSWLRAFIHKFRFVERNLVDWRDFSRDDREDEIASLVPSLVKIGVSHSTEKQAEYMDCIRRVFPGNMHTSPPTEFYTPFHPLETLFHQDPYGQRDIITPVFSKICEYYHQYRHGASGRYVSPYAYIFGASGIGKSFTVGQFARQGYTYVVYYNFSDTWMHRVHPKRSAVADVLENIALEELSTHIECLVAVGLMQVNICRQIGISPRGFFALQVRPMFFQSYHPELVAFVQDVLGELRQIQESGTQPRNTHCASTFLFDTVAEIQRILQSRLDSLTALMSEMYKRLRASDLDPLYFTEPRPNFVLGEEELGAVICFDDIRGLFAPRMKENGSWWGKPPGPDNSDVKSAAMEAALRNLSRCDGKNGDPHFFGILIDRAPLEPLGHRHFKPIIMTETFDIFYDEATRIESGPRAPFRDCRVSPNRLPYLTCDNAYINYIGRPPWAASTLNGYNTLIASELARARCFDWLDIRTETGSSSSPRTRDVAGLIALVSFRVDFDVLLPSLADDLCCRFGRFAIDIDDKTGFVRTMQPSEPALATESVDWTAFNPDVQLMVVESLYKCINGGSIRTDNIGRMVAAFILLLTRDRCIERWVSLMRFARFLYGLLPSATWETIRDCLITNDPVKNLLIEGQMHFNHFVNVLEMPNDDTLRSAYVRQAGIIPPHGCSDIDLIIPVHIPSTDEMTYFIIQVDNTPSSRMTRRLREDARNRLKNAAAQLPQRSAHIALRMALRGRKQDTGTVEVIYPRKETVRNWFFLEREVDKDPLWEDGDNGLALVAVGLDHHLYPGVVHGSNYETRPFVNPEEETDSLEMIACLRKLLDCPIAAPVVETQQQKERFKHLHPLG